MILVYLALIIITMIGSIVRIKDFNAEYLSKNTTQSVNGFFAVLVFCRHFKQYVVFEDNWANKLFLLTDGFLGQLIVVMFFLYSGYGIFRQIQNSSDRAYIRSFLGNRFLPIWIKFTICICLFIITDIITGRIKDFSFLEILLAFTGWTSIGNSNWFMFDTFVFYFLVFISFFRSLTNIRGLVIFSVLTSVFAALPFFVQSSIWWNTLFCFPLGMWYALFKERIELLLRKPSHYWILLIILSIIFVPLWIIRYRLGGLPHIALSAVFAFIILLITMKISIGNSILGYLGKHLFSFYMLQRIVFTAYRHLFHNIYLFFIISLFTTIVVATLFDKLVKLVSFR